MEMSELFKNKKLLFAVSKVWKKQAGQCPYESGFGGSLEREGNVRAAGRHRECLLY